MKLKGVRVRSWALIFVLLSCASIGYVLTQQMYVIASVSSDKIHEISKCLMAMRKGQELVPGRDKSVYPSQFGQDAWINATFGDVLPRHGYFLEFGARDGVQHSNTFFFDRSLGYTGVLIEAVPDEYDQATLNRERYGVSVYHGLACGKDDAHTSKTFVYDSNLKGLGMLVEGNNKEEKVNKLKAMASDRDQKPHISELIIPCLDVQEHVVINGFDSLVIMSVDCEGCELAVLKDFDFELTPVSIILAEINDNLEDILNILIPAGFIPVNARSSDVILVHSQFLAGSNATAQYQKIMSRSAEDICEMLDSTQFS